MPRVVVDRARCLGNARCAAVAPDAFDLDDDGYVVVLVNPVPDERVAQVDQAIRSCPTGALSLAD